MYWRDVAYLCRTEETVDKFNRPQRQIISKREVFCNTKGVKRAEFYQAATAGYKPEIIIVIKNFEYEKERYLEYDGTLYKIIRSYPVERESVELVCEGLAAGNGS